MELTPQARPLVFVVQSQQSPEASLPTVKLILAQKCVTGTYMSWAEMTSEEQQL